jgi:hypothetical protein
VVNEARDEHPPLPRPGRREGPVANEARDKHPPLPRPGRREGPVVNEARDKYLVLFVLHEKRAQ